MSFDAYEIIKNKKCLVQCKKRKSTTCINATSRFCPCGQDRGDIPAFSAGYKPKAGNAALKNDFNE
jgi:hypothetical protein